MAERKRRVPGQRRKPEPEKAPPKRDEEESVYTPAKPFHRKKLLLQLLTVAAVAVAVCVGLSIFFKVDTVAVSGLDKYSYDTVAEASQIHKGDSLLFFSRAEVSSKILQSLPYVKSVRIGITLPGTVNIVIEEVDVVYSLQDRAGNWWLISSGGVVLEKTDGATATACTVIEGIQLKNPSVGAQAEAVDPVADDPSIPVTVTGADRLAAALTVLQAMEKNEVFGGFTSVDVSNIYDLRLWYGTDYQFKLGDGTELVLKLAYVKGALPEILLDHPSGTLDVSDPTENGKILFTPFQ